MKNLVYLLIIILSFSCKNKGIKKPENFIEKDKMINLILDMKIAEKSRMVINKNKKRNQNYMSLVYDKYQIDSIQFKENSDYYTENLEEYEAIYIEVQKRLNDSVKKYERLKKEKDSIAKAKKKKKIKLNKNLKKEKIKLNKKKNLRPLR